MPEENPLVSIIIPTYNRAHLIGETLDSVLAQTYQNWECIVVDDESTDNTDEVMAGYIAKDSRFRYYHRPADRLPGGNAARNYGFEVSNGEYIQWFDSDDLMLNDFIESSIIILLSNKVDFVLFDFKYFNGETGEVSFVRKNQTANLLEDYVSFRINFGTTAIIWKRDLISGLRFNENLTKAQDLDFNFRVLSSKEYTFKNSNTYGFLVRIHENSIVQDYKKNNLKGVSSEVYARKQVFRYMVNRSKDIEVKNKCFDLYTEPLLRMLRSKKFVFVYKELGSLMIFNKPIFLKNINWFLTSSFYLFTMKFLGKGEYKFKYTFLKFKFN